MEIYLDHPDHGAMVVYSPAEAKLWEPKGWKVRAPKVAKEPEREPAAPALEAAPEPEAPRRGRRRKA